MGGSIEAAQLDPVRRVVEVTDWRAFLALESEWNTLVQATDDQVFYRHEFVRTWLESFAPSAPLRILTARDESGELCAVLPLILQRASLFGRPLRQLVSPANTHTPRCDLISADPPGAARLFMNHLALDQQWDLLRLFNVPEAGAAWNLLATAQSLRFAAGTVESIHSPYRTLPGSAEGLDAELKQRLRTRVRRSLRRLAALGTVTLERAAGEADLERRLRESIELEQAGWKGRLGTAIGQDPATRTFYRNLARVAAERGWMSLYTLNVEGQPIAFDYALEYAGRCSVLKGSFDETYREFGPGHLLTYLGALDCAGRGARELDLLGQLSEAKQRWTDRVRAHHWLVIFRSPWLGYALCPPAHGWRPKAKALVVEWAAAPFG